MTPNDSPAYQIHRELKNLVYDGDRWLETMRVANAVEEGVKRPLQRIDNLILSDIEEELKDE